MPYSVWIRLTVYGLVVYISVDVTETPPPTENIIGQLLQLDASVRPGLTENHLRALLTQCVCGIITTRRAFNLHYCHAPKRAKIAAGLVVDDGICNVESSYDTDNGSLA
jgi:hypothetical protein